MKGLASVEVPTALVHRLTRREAEVLALYKLNMPIRVIAVALGIKSGTVDAHLRNITATVGLDRAKLRRELRRQAVAMTTVRVRMREVIIAASLGPAHSRNTETGDGRSLAARPPQGADARRPSQPSTDQDLR